MWHTTVAFLSLTLLVTTALSGQVTAIRFGKLVDGKGHVLSNAVVVVDGERIRSVGTGRAAIPLGAKVIDLSRFTGVPGLIDVHEHLILNYMPGKAPRFPQVSMFLAQGPARRTLEAGVTTVRDLNAPGNTDLALRDLINMGAMIGPRMFVSGPGIFAPSPGIPDRMNQVLGAVRARVRNGSDWIKVFASTGSAEDLTGDATFTSDEIKAIVDLADELGKPTAVHSYGPEAARYAVRAGANSIEHGIDMDDSTISEMARRGIFYVPTIDHNRYYAENGDKLGFAAGYKERFNTFVDKNLETARRAVKAGVRLAMGSDAAFTMYGENTRELGWFVRAGLTPQQALMAATANGAALLGKGNELGAVVATYYADIVPVEGDPLKDINVVINNVRWVMKNGVVVVNRITPRKAQ